MSGLAALLFADDRPAADAVGAMTQALRHRGPDGLATWSDGPAGLGHAALHTTAEDRRGDQPLRVPGTPFVVTADARLDERDALAGALGLRLGPATSDALLVGRAYARWGREAAAHLRGDFAFAVWDPRERLLYAARSPFGARPLVYHRSADGSCVALASEPKALHAVPGIARRLDEARFGDFLMASTGDVEATFFADVHRLPPGTWMAAAPDRLERGTFWRLDPRQPLDRRPGDAAHAAAYRRVLEAAVAARRRADRPVGATLSGGLDSSSIVVVARHQQADGPLPTFSIVFDEVRESDERPFIDAVVAQGGLAPHYLHGDLRSPLDRLDDVHHWLDGPVWTPNLYLHLALYEAARDAGVRVLLDGFLGDNVLYHGWEHLVDLAGSGRLLALARQARGIARHGDDRFWALMGRYVGRFLLRPGRRRPAPAPPPVSPLVDADFARAVALPDRLAAHRPDVPDALPAARRRHLADLLAGEIPLSLETANQVASACGVEPRYPFIDVELARFSYGLPAGQRLADGASRAFVRRALADLLPPLVRDRRDKGNLRPNLERGLLERERSRVEGLVFDDASVLEPYVDVALLREGYRRLRAGDPRPLQPLWYALALGFWLQHERGRGGPRL